MMNVTGKPEGAHIRPESTKIAVLRIRGGAKRPGRGWETLRLVLYLRVQGKCKEEIRDGSCHLPQIDKNKKNKIERPRKQTGGGTRKGREARIVPPDRTSSDRDTVRSKRERPDAVKHKPYFIDSVLLLGAG